MFGRLPICWSPLPARRSARPSCPPHAPPRLRARSPACTARRRVDSLGVVTRNGWLHLFSAPDASEPHDSLCLLARPRSEESAATARPVPGQPGVFEVAKSMASGGYLFRSQHVVRWVLRAESAAAAAEWLALICAHTQLSRPPGSLAARACSVSEASVNGQPQPQPQPHVHREERGSEGEPATPRAHAKHPVGVVELDEEDAG